MTHEPLPKPPPFHWRGLTSFIVTLSFLVLATSGVILYLSPKGRVANWTGWSILGLEKEQWGAVHTLMALVFVVAAVFHLYFNWTIFWNYLKTRAAAKINLKRELALAIVLTAAVFVGTVMEVPPFSTVVALGDRVKDHWEHKAASAPVPHAEEFTIEELAAEAGVTLDVALQRLESAGISGAAHSEKVADIAARNRISPNEVFAIIQARGAGQGGQGRQGGQGGGQGQGQGVQGGGEGHGQRGYGRMTVEHVCSEAGLGVDTALERLRDAGISASSGDVLRDIAAHAGKSPSEIASIALGR